MNVALIGTGKMGAAIARRLAGAGHELTLWNRSADRARAVGVGRELYAMAQPEHGSEEMTAVIETYPR